MSEATEKKPADAKAGEKKAKKAPAAAILNPDKNKNSSWTLERCKKAARRFTNEAEWCAGAPAAYKSAVAHGWVAQCLPTSSATKSRKSA